MNEIKNKIVDQNGAKDMKQKHARMGLRDGSSDFRAGFKGRHL